MRPLLLLALIGISTIAFAQHKKTPSAFIKTLPRPAMAVNDFSHLLTVGERQYLEKEARDYFHRTTNAIVIITLDSLTDPKTKKEYTVEETALLYFNKWGIGDKIKNNGVLLLVSKKPHRVRITVGKGLETVLTDAICQQIIDEELVPAFKQGLFYDGLKNAVIELEHHLDEPAPQPQAATQIPPASSTPGQPFEPETNSYTHDSSSFIGDWLSGLGRMVTGALGFIVLIGVAVIRMFMGGRSGTFTGNGFFYNNNSYNSYNDRRDDSFFSSSSSDSFSSSSSDSGSSSSSGSYDGGSSSGGGASGSW